MVESKVDKIDYEEMWNKMENKVGRRELEVVVDSYQ